MIMMLKWPTRLLDEAGREEQRYGASVPLKKNKHACGQALRFDTQNKNSDYAGVAGLLLVTPFPLL